jgi:hypothetical protein
LDKIWKDAAKIASDAGYLLNNQDYKRGYAAGIALEVFRAKQNFKSVVIPVADPGDVTEEHAEDTARSIILGHFSGGVMLNSVLAEGHWHTIDGKFHYDDPLKPTGYYVLDATIEEKD